MANIGVTPHPSAGAGWRKNQSYESRHRAYLENLRVQKENYMLHRDLELGPKKYKCPSTPPNTRPGTPTSEELQSQFEYMNLNGIDINIIHEEENEFDVNLSSVEHENSKGLPVYIHEKKVFNSLSDREKFKYIHGEGSGAAAVVDLSLAYDENSSKTHLVPYSSVSSSNKRLFTAGKDYQEKMPFYFSGYIEGSSVKQPDKKSAQNTRQSPPGFSIKHPNKEHPPSSPMSYPTYRAQTKRELALLHKRIFNIGSGTGLHKKPPMDPFE